MASPCVRVIMDLAYLTGQRQGDLVRLKRSQLKDNGIHFTGENAQRKPKRRLIVSWSNKLHAVINASQQLSSVAASHARSNGQGCIERTLHVPWSPRQSRNRCGRRQAPWSHVPRHVGARLSPQATGVQSCYVNPAHSTTVHSPLPAATSIRKSIRNLVKICPYFL